MFDIIAISDVHLGSDVCQHLAFRQLLHDLYDGVLPTKELVIVGDLFESMDLRAVESRFHHWKSFKLLHKLRKRIQVTWIRGNHDGDVEADLISYLAGIPVYEEYVSQSGPVSLYFTHGHQWDDFLTAQPFVVWLADWGYWLLQKLDGSHRLARWAKHSSKAYLRCADQIRDGAVARARELGCQVAVCGHIHKAEAGDNYYNAGCWTERPCHYLAIADGVGKLVEYELRAAPEAETI